MTLYFITNGPAIFLHILYYIKNRNYILNEHENCIEIAREGEAPLVLGEKNISHIEVYMAPRFIEYGVTSGMPNENYNYLRFKTLHEEVIITNLLYPDLKYLASKFQNISPVFYKQFMH